MADRGELEKVDPQSSGLVAAFQSVTDGVLDLARNHLELAKLEARQDIKRYGSDAVRAGSGFGLALVGFVMVNVGIVLAAGLLGGLSAMAGTAFGLGVLETGIGLGVANAAFGRMKARDGMTRTRDEIKKSTQWAKEIRESS